MIISRLQLENFRNYESFSYDFTEKNSLILLGKNGQGKTNLLESIFVLSLGKSFRNIDNEDLLGWGKSHFRCKTTVKNINELSDEETLELEYFFSNIPNKHRVLKKNGVKIKNLDFIGNLLSVLFHPEDLNMLYLGPQLRRKYMDILLCQTDKKYLFNLIQFNKTLKQRNAALYEIRSLRSKGFNIQSRLDNLEVWNSQLINYGSEIIISRKKLIGYFSLRLEEKYQKISDGQEKTSLNYKNNISSEIHEKEDLKDAYSRLLNQSIDRDIYASTTLHGPHRDDMEILLNGKVLLANASRGEIRSLLLAIKFCEIEYIVEQKKEHPIVLLDDVFSELDENRQEKLLFALEPFQTVITSTEVPEIINLSKNKKYDRIDIEKQK